MRLSLLLFFSYCIVLDCLRADTTAIATGANVLTLKTQGSAPASPPSGYLSVYVDTATGLLKTKDSAGTTASLGGVDPTAILSITNTTDSTSASTGSIKTLGGMGVAKSIHVGTGGNIHILSTTAASVTMSPSGSLVGSLIAEGGATILKDSWINGVRVGRGLADIITNTVVGDLALGAITTGAANTGIGYRASRLVTTGARNTVVGSSALMANVTGSGNVAVGASALATTTASGNTALGDTAFTSLTTGSNAIAIGYDAGHYNVDASDLTDAVSSIYIGAFATGLAGGNENAIVIGAAASSEGNNTTVLGNSLTTTTHIYGTTKLEGGLVRTMNSRVASYALVAADAHSIVTMDVVGANTLTIPADADVALPISIVIDVVQLGAGLTSVAGDVGVVVHGNLNSAGQYMGLSLMKIAADEWVVIGGVP